MKFCDSYLEKRLNKFWTTTVVQNFNEFTGYKSNSSQDQTKRNMATARYLQNVASVVENLYCRLEQFDEDRDYLRQYIIEKQKLFEKDLTAFEPFLKISMSIKISLVKDSFDKLIKLLLSSAVIESKTQTGVGAGAGAGATSGSGVGAGKGITRENSDALYKQLGYADTEEDNDVEMDCGTDGDTNECYCKKAF